MTKYVLAIVLKADVTYIKAVNRLFYITMPNYCMSEALILLQKKYDEINYCSRLFGANDQTTFCEMVRTSDTTNDCCPGELQMSSVVISQISCMTSHDSYFLNLHKISLISSCPCT